MFRLRFLLKNLFTSLPAVLFTQLLFSLAHYFLALVTSYLYRIPNTFYIYDIATNSAGFNLFNSFIFASSLLLTASLIFFEVGVLILIVLFDFYHDARVPLFQIFRAVFYKIKKTLELSSLPFLFFFMLYPREDTTPPSLLNFSIPDFVISEITKNAFHFTIAGIFVFLISYFIYRNSFSPQEFFLSDVSLWDAIKKSWKGTRSYGNFSYGVFLKLLLYSFVLSFFFTLPLEVLSSLLSSFLYFLAPFFGMITVPLAKLLEAISRYPLRGVLTFVFVAFVTYVYLKKKEEEGKNMKDLYVYNLSEEPFFMKYFHELQLILKDKRKGFFILLVISLATVVYGSHKIVWSEIFIPKPLVYIAHRGSTENAFENSIASLEEAVSKKAHIIEIDVWQTQDGQLVVSHDKNLKRVTGTSIDITENTFSSLSSLVLKNGEPLPRLRDFLQRVPPGTTLLVEIKVSGGEKDVAENILKEVSLFGQGKSVSYASLDLSTVLRIKELDKQAFVGYIVYAYVGRLSSIPVDFFGIQEGLFSPADVAMIHRAGKKVYLWTVNNDDRLRGYILAGVDGVITDTVSSLQKSEQALHKDFRENPLRRATFFGVTVFY
jgi:glycerophosphoryl diester phosphodiesterase